MFLLREFIQICLLERRRSGETGEERLQHEIDTLKQYVNKGYFFHMTNDYSLQGINVKTEFNTPIGIYFFPLTQEFYEMILKDNLPFAGNRKFISIYKLIGNIVTASLYTYKDLLKDTKQLGYSAIDIAETGEKVNVRHPMSILMYFLYDGNFTNQSKRLYIKATMKLKQLGYSGMFDDLGLGIIHPNEPTQAFIISSKYCTRIDVLNNPRIIKQQQNQNILKKLNIMSEKEQLESVQQRGYNIEFIKHPSETVQLAAVKQNGYAIKFIENPSETVQLAAIKQNGLAIQFIENPSEIFQRIAVKNHWLAIKFIENPSETVQIAAVKQNKPAIRFIENPTENVKKIAMSEEE